MKEIEIVIPKGKKRKAVKLLEELKIKNYRTVSLDHKNKIEFLITDSRTDDVIEKLKTKLEIGKSLDDGMILISDKKMVAPFVKEKETVKDPKHDLLERARNAANMDKNHVIFIALSTIIAVIGLQTNMALVIFGALLIAPVMEPILGNTYGIVRRNAVIVRHSMKTLVTGITLIIIISLAVPVITMKTQVTNEMMLRTSVDMTDLIIALVIGAIAALAFANNKSTTLIGVAAAISIMPPLANAGILLMLKHYALALNAISLFLTNILGMYSGSLATFLMIEQEKIKKTTRKKTKS